MKKILLLLFLGFLLFSCTSMSFGELDNKAMSAKEYASDLEKQAHANFGTKPNAEINLLYKDTIQDVYLYSVKPIFKNIDEAYVCLIYREQKGKTKVIKLTSPPAWAITRRYVFYLNRRGYTLSVGANQNIRLVHFERDGFSLIEPYTIK